MVRFKLSIFVVGAALLLSACMVSGGDSKADSAESLLNAEGSWKVIEQDRQPVPAVMHNTARADVNVRDMKRHMGYASMIKKAHKKDTNFRLLVLERQMRDVSKELEHYILGHTLKGYDSYASLGLPEPARKPVAVMAAKSAAKPAPVLSGATAVRKFRMGQHPGKTRLVLDLNRKSHFSYDLDNGEKLLLVDIADAGWDAKAERRFAKHPLIAGYSAHDNGSGGTMLVIELKKAVKVLLSTGMKPYKAGGYSRIVFDIAAE